MLRRGLLAATAMVAALPASAATVTLNGNSYVDLGSAPLSVQVTRGTAQFVISDYPQPSTPLGGASNVPGTVLGAGGAQWDFPAIDSGSHVWGAATPSSQGGADVAVGVAGGIVGAPFPINLGSYNPSPAKRLLCNVSTLSGQHTLSLAACVDQFGNSVANPFTNADIGAYIVVNYAGPALATSPVSAVPVASPGSGYVAPTTVNVSGAAGAGFFGYTNMALESATVNAGGSGCANSPATFTLTGGTGTPATFTATPVGGSLTGQPLAVANPGSYTPTPTSYALATLANPLPNNGAAGAGVTGGGCAGATVNPSWGVGSVTASFPGYNYSPTTTAAVASGNATLGNATMAAPLAAPLATTIAGVSNTGALLTLGGNASQTLTAQSEIVTWGQDNSALIARAIAAAGSTPGGYLYIPPAPNIGGAIGWGTAQQFTLPSASILRVEGAGASESGGSAIVFLAEPPATYGVFKDTQSAKAGSVLQNIEFDGNKVVPFLGYFACAQHMIFDKAAFDNAAPYGENINLGDGVTTGCNTSRVINSRAHNWSTTGGFYSNYYTGYGDFPLRTAHISDTDSWWTNFEGVNAIEDEIFVGPTSAITHLISDHGWSAPAAYPTNGLNISSPTTVVDYDADNPGQTGINVNSAQVTVLGGFVSNPQSATATSGVVIQNNLPGVTVTGFNGTFGLTVAANRVAVNGVRGLNAQSFGNSGAPSWNVAGVFGLTAATWADNQVCTPGQISVDANFIYVCTATNVVERAALSGF